METQDLKYAFLVATVVAGAITLPWMMASEIDSPEIGDVPEIGEVLNDGTIYGGLSPGTGEAFYVTSQDAPGLYTWYQAEDYCENLTAYGHDDWTLPTQDQLNRLYENKDTGAFSGTFNESAHGFPSWYWSSEPAGFKRIAWGQGFTDGSSAWGFKDFDELSVRCVRLEPAQRTANLGFDGGPI